ncbi:MAG: hypothetical protein ABJJ90_02775, partial [Lentilitoribacter sp.]
MQSGNKTSTRSSIFSIEGDAEFTGDRGDYLQASHSDAFELSNGTIALTFEADSIEGNRTLFSKD